MRLLNLPRSLERLAPSTFISKESNHGQCRSALLTAQAFRCDQWRADVTQGKAPFTMYTNEQHIALDQDLSLEKNFAEAEICCREAIQLNPLDSVAHNDLGWSLQVQGDQEGAIACYKRALQIDPSLRAARRNLAILLVIQGHREASFHLWHEEVLADSGGLAWLQGLVSTEMRRRDLRLAGEYAAIHARLRCGSQWYSDSQNDPILPLPIQPPASALTIPKLRHDIEQFEYLQDHGVLGDEFTPIIKDYLRIVERLDQRGINTAVPLDDDDRRTIGHVYNRIVHIRHTPRVERALADKWNGGAVESQYIDNPPGIVIVDEFLSPEALESLRLFLPRVNCLVGQPLRARSPWRIL